MLVLSRRVGEEIIINGSIRVTVVSVKGDRIRLGIAAPKDVEVDRAEVYERRKEFAPVGTSSMSTPIAAGSGAIAAASGAIAAGSGAITALCPDTVSLDLPITAKAADDTLIHYSE